MLKILEQTVTEFGRAPMFSDIFRILIRQEDADRLQTGRLTAVCVIVMVIVTVFSYVLGSYSSLLLLNLIILLEYHQIYLNFALLCVLDTVFLSPVICVHIT